VADDFRARTHEIRPTVLLFQGGKQMLEMVADILDHGSNGWIVRCTGILFVVLAIEFGPLNCQVAVREYDALKLFRHGEMLSVRAQNKVLASSTHKKQRTAAHSSPVIDKSSLREPTAHKNKAHKASTLPTSWCCHVQSCSAGRFCKACAAKQVHRSLGSTAPIVAASCSSRRCSSRRCSSARFRCLWSDCTLYAFAWLKKLKKLKKNI